jgi:NAD-dependent dihydropyrimidine dehydrogenase PreA subunit
MANPTIPREKIPWFPTIDPDLCIGDQDCVNLCKNDVLAFDEDSFKVSVIKPNNCVVGCSACAQICPQEAIKFPEKEGFRATLRKLRLEAQEAERAAAPPAEAMPVERT